MARYKLIDTNPRLLPVNLAAQLLLGTFEHAVDHLLDHAIGLSRFDGRFRNDTTGAPAYPPAVLLKVVLCAYARGIVRSRAIARLCEDHVTFIALCGTRTPHFTTIAAFVSGQGPDIAHVFAAVLAVCDQQGLIGREMFAIDGVKLPCNVSKRRSGKRAHFERQAEKLEAAAARMLTRHQAIDATEDGPPDPPDGPRRHGGRGTPSAWRALSATRRSCGRGSPRIPTTGAALKAPCASAIAPIQTVRRWPPARASCRATRPSRRWMRGRRSSWTRRRMAPERSRCCRCPWSPPSPHTRSPRR